MITIQKIILHEGNEVTSFLSSSHYIIFLEREFLARNLPVLEIFGINLPPVCTHISACIRLLPTHISALGFSRGAILTQTWQVQLKNVSEL